MIRSQAMLFAIAGALVLLAVPGIHWIVTLAALASVAVVAALHPPVVVAAVVLSIPVQSSLMLPFVRGEITFTQLAMFGLVFGWAALFWKRKIWLDSVTVGFLLVLAAYVISFVAVDSPSLWFQETYRWAIAGVFYVICRSVITGWNHVRLILWATLAGVAFVSIFSAYQILTVSGPADFLVGGAIRVYATFGTPNTLAAYLEMTVPLLLACVPIAWFVKGDFVAHRVEKWMLVLVSLAGIAVLGLTQSRGGMIGLFLAMVVLWYYLPNRARLPMLVVAVVMFGGFALTAPGQSQLSRFAELGEETSQEAGGSTQSSYDVGSGRGALWGTALAMIEDKPFTGIGAGEFDEHHREYAPSWIDRFPRGQAHNVWLHMGAQAGIWGILAYAWWFGASIWSVVTARRRVMDPQRYWVLTGVIAVFLAYAAHSMVDYLNVLSLGLQLSVLTAIALNFAPGPLKRYQQSPASRHAATSTELATCPQ